MKSLQEFQAELRAEGVKGRRILSPALSYKVKKTVRVQEPDPRPSSSKAAADTSGIQTGLLPSPPLQPFHAFEQDLMQSLDASAKAVGDDAPADGATSGARICDLCDKDKAKIAKIIQRVVKLNEEKSTLEALNMEAQKKLAEDSKIAEEKMSALRKQMKELKRKFGDSLKMVKAYQDRLKELEKQRKEKDTGEEEEQFQKLKEEVERLHKLVIEHTKVDDTHLLGSHPPSAESTRADNQESKGESLLSALALEISEATQEVAVLRKSLLKHPNDVRVNLRLRSKQQALHELENLLFETKFGGRGEEQAADLRQGQTQRSFIDRRNASFMKREGPTNRFASWPERHAPTELPLRMRFGGKDYQQSSTNTYGRAEEIDYSKVSTRLQNKDLELTTQTCKEGEAEDRAEEAGDNSSSEDEILESFLNNERKARVKKKSTKPKAKKRSKASKSVSKSKAKSASPKKKRGMDAIPTELDDDEEDSITDAQNLDT